MKHLWIWALAVPLLAQPRHELGLTLGRVNGVSRSAVQVDGGSALQANYGLRLAAGARAALFGELHFLANPQRVVTSTNRAATRDVASLYVTPGVRLQLNPAGRLQPYGAIGGGWAVHEHSTLDIGGAPNAAPRTATTGAFTYGGGLDASLSRWLAARFEVRDFLTGSPRYNVAVNGRQHNLVIGGGLVLRF